MLILSRVKQQPLLYLPHVDGLRALAVALVVIFHAWPAALPGGFIGVDVFFVISGFIITRQLAAEMEQERFSYSAFLGRRARRLIPAAAVCCILVSIAAVFLLMPEALVAFGESLAAVWTMTANFYFYSHSGYFDAPSAEAPLLHMWSLAVEDQFYLTWPLLLLLLFRKLATRERIVAVTLLVAAASLAHSEVSVQTDPNLAFYLPFSRAFELLAGCALALGLPFVRAIATVPRTGIDLAGLVLVVGSSIVLHNGSPVPGLAVVPAIVGSVLLIGAGLYGPTPVSRLLSMRPVVLVGKMSYSIYLYHWPLLALATYRLGRAPDATEAALLVLASLVLAALSWIFVERLLTRRLGLYDATPPALLRGTVAVATTFGALAIVVALTRGLPQRLDAPAYEVYRAASAGNPLRRACDGYERAFQFNDFCTFGRPLPPDGSYEIAVFGDSNADHFVPMIAKLAKDANLSGRQVTHSSCAPLIGAAFDRTPASEEQCARYQETILKFLDRNPGLKIAVLGGAWGSYSLGVHPNRVASRSGATEAQSLAQFAKATIAIFRKRGIKVLVVGQIPTFDTFSLKCFTDAARNGTEETECTVPRQTVDALLGSNQHVVEAIDPADPDVTFLDMRKLLCSDTSCSAFKDKILMYRDRRHLNAVGSAHLSRYAKLPELAP